MKPQTRAITIAAALTALLAGCGTSAPASTTARATTATATPASCRQQYETWKHGPANAALKHMEAALRQVSVQGDAEDMPGVARTLGQAGSAAARVAAYPAPACADPKGYLPQMLARIKAAGDNAKSSSGLAALVLAAAPLNTVPGIEKKLNAELDRTVGKGR